MSRVVFNPLRWPLALRAPLLFAAFMVAVSVAMTSAVLSRLAETQQRHLDQLFHVYLDGLAAAIVPFVLRDDVWEVFDAIDRNSSLGPSFGAVRVVVTNSAGLTIASNNPRHFAAGQRPTALEKTAPGRSVVALDVAAALASARRPLVYQERRIGDIHASVDATALLQERHDVLTTLVATNAAVTMVLAAIGYWLIRRMLGPLRRLSAHLDRSISGPIEPVPIEVGGPDGSEFRRLFGRFNAMAEAVNEREALAKRLAQEERLGSLGRLASGMAHEINNPLGGLFNAIDTLKVHGDRQDVRASSLSLIERGLKGIRDVVRSVLATYRADERSARMLSLDDLEDVRLLAGPEASRRGVELLWSTEAPASMPVAASHVRQIVLNLVLNAVQASDPGRLVSVAIIVNAMKLAIDVEDQGPGLPGSAEAVLAGSTAHPIGFGEGTGLGLWMTRRLVLELGGRIESSTSALGGAAIRVELPLVTSQELRDVA